MSKPRFSFVQTHVKGGKTFFSVSEQRTDGSSKPVGQVIHWWISHLEMVGWEAIGPDGHRAVHKTQRQAALALLWDGTGYPFPISRGA